MMLEIGKWKKIYMMEIGMEMECLEVVYVMKIKKIKSEKVMNWIDLVEYKFIEIGLGEIVVVIVKGKN